MLHKVDRRLTFLSNWIL